MKIEVWMEDEKTGIKCGLNCDGKLFLGDNKSGYNLHDNPENRERVINDFCRYTGRQKPVTMANGKPYRGNENIEMEVEKMSMEDRFKKAIAEAEKNKTKAIITKKLFDIRNGEFYKAHITEGNDFTIAFITLNGETTAYFSGLIETLEEFNEGNFQLEAVGDDFKIIFD